MQSHFRYSGFLLLALLTPAARGQAQEDVSRDTCRDDACRRAFWQTNAPEETNTFDDHFNNVDLHPRAAGLNGCWVADGRWQEAYPVHVLDERYKRAIELQSHMLATLRQTNATSSLEALANLARVTQNPAAQFSVVRLDNPQFARDLYNGGGVDGWAQAWVEQHLTALAAGGPPEPAADGHDEHMSPGCYASYVALSMMLAGAPKLAAAGAQAENTAPIVTEGMKRLAGECASNKVFPSCVSLANTLASVDVKALLGDAAQPLTDQVRSATRQLDDAEWEVASKRCKAARDENACDDIAQYLGHANQGAPAYGAHQHDASQLRDRSRDKMDRLRDQRIGREKFERHKQVAAECDRRAGKCRQGCDPRDQSCFSQCATMRREWCEATLEQQQQFNGIAGRMESIP